MPKHTRRVPRNTEVYIDAVIRHHNLHGFATVTFASMRFQTFHSVISFVKSICFATFRLRQQMIKVWKFLSSIYGSAYVYKIQITASSPVPFFNCCAVRSQHSCRPTMWLLAVNFDRTNDKRFDTRISESKHFWLHFAVRLYVWNVHITLIKRRIRAVVLTFDSIHM